MHLYAANRSLNIQNFYLIIKIKNYFFSSIALFRYFFYAGKLVRFMQKVR
jgi:hypothetical protein